MSHWYRLALAWAIVWTLAMVLCAAFHAPEYVWLGLATGGLYPPLYAWSGWSWAKYNREREERMRKLYGRHWPT